MQPPPLDALIPHNSKKRAFSRPGAFMDSDVVEIAPPVRRSSKEPKQKEVVFHEVIDIDNDDDCADLMVIDKKVDAMRKGKAVIDVDDYCNGQIGDDGVNGSADGSINGGIPLDGLAQDSHAFVHLDGQIYDPSPYDEDYMDIFEDVLDVDQYDTLQAHFDNMDIPPGVEAPIPWLSDLPKYKNEAGGGSSANGSSSLINTEASLNLQEMEHTGLTEPVQTQANHTSVSSHGLSGLVDAASHPTLMDTSTPYLFTQAGQSKKNRASSQRSGNSKSFAFGLESFKPRRFFEPFRNKKTPDASGSSSKPSAVNKFDLIKPPPGVEAPLWGEVINNSGNNPGGGFSFGPAFPVQAGTHTPTPGSEAFSSWVLGHPKNIKGQSYKHHSAYSSYVSPLHPTVHILPAEEEDGKWPDNLTEVQGNGVEEDVMRKFKLFKQFDTVQDFSDHHYKSDSCGAKQPSKNWAKRIQEEWKILEKDLPDTIFVRVYETRMDLLRAVIIGAEGTPYHDGLFFFDVSFPSGYPNVPPKVYYHSGGLRINPNLYNCGKVCLSLLGTWSGHHKNERWLPGVSTALQVLVSIQGLILNSKPYFNEPGYERTMNTDQGETTSMRYNEDTFILSLRTMTYTLKKPPKHFEDLIVGHFFKCAPDILMACKAYVEGAQVGCLLKGGIQDVDADHRSGSRTTSRAFKETVSSYIRILVKDFSRLGVKDLEKFMPPAPAPAPAPAMK
ncbi:probable ubiquitin-conjugating enzyme E2 25 isoform X1 [Rhodamnia argentea]|uniref:E2 ubiquitin-conjugating enzyme n=2 Tax=Rhodamnia argentea TaxID=178133 RepID=A0A8B8MQB3_9MYRT|nr:probable ubiquitin-conjugating enzyme E2 25 isoform X1 [Rhodamnia argentea]